MIKSHPSDELLVDFLLARLRHRQAEPIEAHMETCEICATRLLELEPTIRNDSLIEGLRKAALPVDEPTPTPLPWRYEWPDALKNHPRFRVRALLSRGEGESVYLAEDKSSSQRVALKLVSGDAQAADRIASLCELLANRTPPRVIRPTFVEQLDQQLLIAEEYRSGATLREVVCTRGRLSPQEVILHSRQIVESLTPVHSLGRSHGDLQLADCIVTESGIAVRGWERRRCREEVSHDPRQDTVCLGRCILGLLTGHTLLDSRSELPFGELWSDVPTAMTEVLRSMTQTEYATPQVAIHAIVKAASPKRWWQRFSLFHS